jgi:hypothetical protein
MLNDHTIETNPVHDMGAETSNGAKSGKATF